MQLTIGDILLYVTVFFGLFTSIFFLLTLIANTERRPRLRRHPSVCIIVPCYNEEQTIAGTLESLLALDYPRRKLEIAVVDDGSTDSTYRIAKAYEKRGVKVYRKRNGGKHTALNYVLKRTRAEIVGALDADSFVAKDALKKMVPYFGGGKVMAVTPSMKIAQPRTWLQHVQWTEYLVGIFLRKVFTHLGSQHVTPGPFSLYRREFFLRHGFYRPAHNTEDIEIALRIQANDYEIENASDAFVYTLGPPGWKSLWRQRVRWYHGFLRNVEDYRHLVHWSHGHLGLFVLPGSFFSVALVVFAVLYTASRMLASGWDKLVYLRATGWDFLQWNFTFDLFFLNLSSTAILGFIAIFAGLVLILLARKIAEEDRLWRHYFWFFLAYWFLFGLWWMGAFYARAMRGRVAWGHKSD